MRRDHAAPGDRAEERAVVIRHAEEQDLPEILRVYAAARAYMKASGNPSQWGDDKPDISMITEDIRLKRSYVVFYGGHLSGIFMLLTGIEPTYLEIDGAWPDQEPYVTIHRIAGDGTMHGVMKQCLDFVARLSKEQPEAVGGPIHSIRMDTHKDNKTMQHLFLKHGFRYCGIIIIDDGTPRLAYQKDL